jgi:hypothetical protein
MPSAIGGARRPTVRTVQQSRRVDLGLQRRALNLVPGPGLTFSSNRRIANADVVAQVVHDRPRLGLGERSKSRLSDREKQAFDRVDPDCQAIEGRLQPSIEFAGAAVN